MLRAVAKEQEWQPMDSAPKDKTEVILKIPETDFSASFSCAGEYVRDDWYFANCDPQYTNPIGNDFAEPTGWQPLPTVRTWWNALGEDQYSAS